LEVVLAVAKTEAAVESEVMLSVDDEKKSVGV
jgi:hypothetical protein